MAPKSLDKLTELILLGPYIDNLDLVKITDLHESSHKNVEQSTKLPYFNNSYLKILEFKVYSSFYFFFTIFIYTLITRFCNANY